MQNEVTKGESNAGKEEQETPRVSTSPKRESVLQFPSCLLPSSGASDLEGEDGKRTFCLSHSATGHPTGTLPRFPTPPRNLALQSVSVREAARFLSKMRLNYEPSYYPHSFLIVHKEAGPDVDVILASIWMLVSWLASESPAGDHTTIYICDTLLPSIPQGLSHLPNNGRLKFWLKGPIKEDIDLVISLGGDGTVLNAAWLFQSVVPPIIPFHFGSVGFLNIYSFDNFSDKLTQMIEQGCRVNIRMRLACKVIRRVPVRAEVSPNLFENFSFENESNHSSENTNGDQILTHHVMNELVVDRGASAIMTTVDLFTDGQLMTTVSADGVIVATPTGSTAYSLSAGGCVVHPEVPCMLVTPICPHTLSFRPLILPESIILVLRISPHSRSSAWASFDGRSRVELQPGDGIEISGSNFPVPTVCHDDQTQDWFHGLARCLHWNDTPSKKPL